MAGSSVPFDAITGLLGSSDAWKKYFPGLSRSSSAPDYSSYKPSKEASALPWSLKGIDFTTGKTVDLNAFGQPQTELTPPSYDTPASPYSSDDIKQMYRDYSEMADEQRLKDEASQYGFMKALQGDILDTAYKTRQWDLQNKLNYQKWSPVVAADIAATKQQQQSAASGDFARELGAVSDAAYKAGLISLQALSPRQRVG